jgi:hypothetical protein
MLKQEQIKKHFHFHGERDIIFMQVILDGNVAKYGSGFFVSFYPKEQPVVALTNII